MSDTQTHSEWSFRMQQERLNDYPQERSKVAASQRSARRKRSQLLTVEENRERDT